MKYILSFDTYNDWKLHRSGYRERKLHSILSRAKDNQTISIFKDDPRKHGDSTYFAFNVANAESIEEGEEIVICIGDIISSPEDTFAYTIDWGDGTVETKTVTKSMIEEGGWDFYEARHTYKKSMVAYIELYNTSTGYALTGFRTMHPNACIRSTYDYSGGLYEVITSSMVTGLGDYAFSDCNNLQGITLSKSIKSIGYYAFAYSGLTSITIPEGVTTIDCDVFQYIQNLKTLYLPSTLTTLGVGEYSYGSLFEGTRSIETIYCNSLTAPTLGQPLGLPSKCKVYIPQGATGYEAWESQLQAGAIRTL